MARKRGSEAPENFQITEQMRLWAVTKTPWVQDLEAETDSFLDHHRARGTLFIDWLAAWRNWMRNTVKYGIVGHCVKPRDGQFAEWQISKMCKAIAEVSDTYRGAGQDYEEERKRALMRKCSQLGIAFTESLFEAALKRL